jgi:hypothetical protein
MTKKQHIRIWFGQIILVELDPNVLVTSRGLCVHKIDEHLSLKHKHLDDKIGLFNKRSFLFEVWTNVE